MENIIEEKKYKIKTDKNNEMDLFLRNYNNEELSFTLFSKNQIYSKKYELKCNLEEFQKNRFFKIFVNVKEIMEELENKIEKSNFIEESNCIVIEIQIGLIIIKEINLVVDEIEKTKEELKNDINNLIYENEKLLENIQVHKSEIEKLKNELKEKDKKIKEGEKNIQILNKEKEDSKIKIQDWKKKYKNLIIKNEEMEKEYKLLIENKKYKDKEEKIFINNIEITKDDIHNIYNKIDDELNLKFTGVTEEHLVEKIKLFKDNERLLGKKNKNEIINILTSIIADNIYED